MRRLFVFAALAAALIGLSTVARADDDTAAAAATRKKLDAKVSPTWKETPLKDVIEELTDSDGPLKGVRILYDSGVSKNQAITFSGKDVTVAEALDGAFKKNGLGYLIMSQKGAASDGAIKIKQGKERGTPLADDAPKDKPKDKEKDK
jgi:hypothetical protein